MIKPKLDFEIVCCDIPTFQLDFKRVVLAQDWCFLGPGAVGIEQRPPIPPPRQHQFPVILPPQGPHRANRRPRDGPSDGWRVMRLFFIIILIPLATNNAKHVFMRSVDVCVSCV